MSVSSSEAQVSTFDRHTYEDPFLDIASQRLPKSWRKLQEMCQIYGMTHPQMSPVVWRLSEYPITSIIYNGDPEEKRITKKFLEEEESILDRCIEFGLDYNSGGNCFVTIQFPFIRYYMCLRCNSSYQSKDIKYKYANGKFTGQCKTCKSNEVLKPIDQYIKRMKGITIVRLEPMNITIKHNRITNKCFYYYDIPSETKNAIRSGDRDIIDTTPIEYLKCAYNNTKMKLDRIFHFKRPTLSGRDMQWGFPLILPALKDAYLNQIHKKSDEQIALEHSVPLRVMYPEPTSQDPLARIAMGSFKGFMEQNLRYWRKDKNSIILSPVPIGVRVVGGDQSAYQTVQQRQLIVDEIFGAMNVTRGFVMGGEQWNAASITQRTMENMFVNYLRRLDACLQWIVNTVSSYLGVKFAKVSMKPFRKIDDVQMLQLITQLAREKRASWSEVISRMEMDFDQQTDQISREVEVFNKINMQELVSQAEAGARAVVMQAAAQNQAESVSSVLQEHLQGMGVQPPQQPGPQQPGPQQPGDQQQGQGASPEQGGPGAPPEEGQSGAPEAKAEPKPKPKPKPKPEPKDEKPSGDQEKADKQISAWAMELLAMSPRQMKTTLGKMEQQDPELARAVAERAHELASKQDSAENASSVLVDAKSPEEIAQRLMMASPTIRMKALNLLQNQNPHLALAVMRELSRAGSGQNGKGGGADKPSVDMRPLPEQLPPRRESRTI